MNATMDRRIFEIGEFRVDGRQRRMFDRAGEPVPLTARAFDVLMFMLQRPGELLDKSSVMNAVWPGTVVEENNLTQCIFTLRRAFRESAGEHRYIVTVPGRGYQFVAQVRAISDAAANNEFTTDIPVSSPEAPRLDSAPETAHRHRTLRIAAGAAVVATLAIVGYLFWPRAESRDSAHSIAATAAASSIVVLPFADLSASSDMEYFADGLSEELTNSLAKVGNLRVIGRRSAFSFKGKNDDASAIGAKLKVAHILEGSVRKQGAQVRITAELSRTADGTSLWSATYDRKLDDVLDIQSAIAREVVAALGPVVQQSNGVRTAASDARLTGNPGAYAAYLRGMYFYERRTVTDLPRARDELLRAVELDPKFAMAHAWLARTYAAFASRAFGDINANRSLALASLDRAMTLDPAIGDLWWVQVNFVEGPSTPLTMRASNMERALIATPFDPDAMIRLGINYLSLGRRTEALNTFERAYQADPLWAQTAFFVGWSSYRFKQDRQRFLELAEEIEKVSPTDYTSFSMRAMLAYNEGRALDWDRWSKKALEIAPTDHKVHCGLAFEYLEVGLIDAALYHAGVSRKLAPSNAAGWYDAAHILLYSGDIAAARPFVQEAATKMPGDFDGQLAQADLQYFTGDCAGAIKSIYLSSPRLDQPAAALNLVNDPSQVPVLVWCLRKEGHAERADEIARVFNFQYAPPYAPGSIDADHARIAAANGDRDALVSHLRRLLASNSMSFAFARHEPMIQPYLHDTEVVALLDKLEARRAEWRKIIPKSTMRVVVPGIDS